MQQGAYRMDGQVVCMRMGVRRARICVDPQAHAYVERVHVSVGMYAERASMWQQYVESMSRGRGLRVSPAQ